MKPLLNFNFHACGTGELECSAKTANATGNPYDVVIIDDGHISLFLDFEQTEKLASVLSAHIAARAVAPAAEVTL